MNRYIVFIALIHMLRTQQESPSYNLGSKLLSWNLDVCGCQLARQFNGTNLDDCTINKEFVEDRVHVESVFT